MGDAIRMISGLLDGVDGATFAAEARKSLAPSLMLAAFTPVLADALERRHHLFQMAVQDFCTVRGADRTGTDAESPAQDKAKVEIDATQLWKLRPASLAEQLAAAVASGHD